MNKSLAVFVLALVYTIAVVIFVTKPQGTSKPVEILSSKPQEGEVQSISIAKNIYTQSQTAPLDTILWRIISVKDWGKEITGNEQVPDGRTEGRFVRIVVKVKNNSTKTFHPSEPILVDSNNREYHSWGRSWEFIPIEQTFSFEGLQPQSQRQYTVIYDLPSDASGLMLKASNGDTVSEQIAHIKLDL